MFKSLIKVILIVVLGGIFAVEININHAKIRRLIYYSPCDTPIEYKTGDIDSRFNIKPETFLTDNNEATDIWNKLYGKPLFIFDPKAKLVVSLVYDERQSLNSKINDLDTSLKDQKGSIDPKETEFKNLEADFKTKLSDLNSQIDYWNARGGAPKEEFDKLTQQQKDLHQMADKLNSMAQSLNQSVQNYNFNVSQYNKTLDTYNTVIESKPEEGLYKGADDQIDIYITNSQKELIHTLAHEFGHALGLGHNDNKNSIMYMYTSEFLIPTQADIGDLNNICRERSIFENIKENINALLGLLNQKLKTLKF